MATLFFQLMRPKYFWKENTNGFYFLLIYSQRQSIIHILTNEIYRSITDPIWVKFYPTSLCTGPGPCISFLRLFIEWWLTDDTAASESGRKVHKLKGQQNWCFPWADIQLFLLGTCACQMQSDLGGFRHCSYDLQDLCYAIAMNSTLIPILHLLLKQSKHLQWNWPWPSIWKQTDAVGQLLWVFPFRITFDSFSLLIPYIQSTNSIARIFKIYLEF